MGALVTTWHEEGAIDFSGRAGFVSQWHPGISSVPPGLCTHSSRAPGSLWLSGLVGSSSYLFNSDNGGSTQYL